MKNYLNFETDIKDLETELEKLKDPYNQEGLSEVNTDKISKIQSEIDDKLNEVYSNLNSWQTTLVARHEDRPKSKFFIENFTAKFFLNLCRCVKNLKKSLITISLNIIIKLVGRRRRRKKEENFFLETFLLTLVILTFLKK